MAFVTVGNLKRFLEKLKTYISSNYVKSSGTTFTEGVEIDSSTDTNDVLAICGGRGPGEIRILGDADYGTITKTSQGFIGNYNGILKTNDTVLDSRNYTVYAPSTTGTGATGTWPISITGNATNDSDGNKIVDTYAKKTDIPTNSITVDDELDVLSENPVQNKVVSWALEDKLGNGGWKYSKKKTYDSAGYYANNVLQRAGVEQYPFLEVQFRDEGGPKVSISSNDVTVYGSKDHQNDESTKVMLDGYGLTYSYGKHNAKLILDETVNGGIRLLTDSDSLTIPSSNFVGYEKKLKFNSANIATEDYVKSAIAAIASYDDTAF